MIAKLLRWFYPAVQFVMLAVSIPKVFLLFHAYDPNTEFLIGGVDVVSWAVGIAIDLCSTFTAMAAMNKYEETGKRNTLIAPAVIVLFCATVSVIANYEAAAVVHPAQYAHVSLFTHPALLINPLIVSAPPVLVLLLIFTVPNVLSRGRIKTVAEIEQETATAEKIIERNTRLRKARLLGLRESVQVVAGRQEQAMPQLPPPDDDTDPEPPRALPAAAPAQTKMTRALWNAMPLKDRVLQSTVITPQEIAGVLDVSLSHARNITKELEKQTVEGRSGYSYQTVIQSLYDTRGKNSYDWARKLETTLKPKRRSLQVVPDATEEADTDEESNEA